MKEAFCSTTKKVMFATYFLVLSPANCSPFYELEDYTGQCTGGDFGVTGVPCGERSNDPGLGWVVQSHKSALRINRRRSLLCHME